MNQSKPQKRNRDLYRIKGLLANLEQYLSREEVLTNLEVERLNEAADLLQEVVDKWNN